LKGHTILQVAKLTGAKAIHPGYGFLSENAAFAEALDNEGTLLGVEKHGEDVTFLLRHCLYWAVGSSHSRYGLQKASFGH
jgi:Biotin carboxylase, N-terminal domain